MVRKTAIVFLSFLLLATTAPAFAGGPPPSPTCAPISYPPRACGPAGLPGSNYWGDAPFPGLCGGIVALPFLVVGSLLGGNSAGPCAPMAPVTFGCPPAQAPNCGPAPCPPPRNFPVNYGPVRYAPPAPCGVGVGVGGGGLFSGLPCFELCSGLLGNITGGGNPLF